LEANKLTGAARIPNELIADAPALTSWLNQALPQGLAHYEDQAFFNGSGVGEPLGFLQSPAIVQFDRGSADTIVIADIAGMYARMLPQSLGSAVWFVSQTALPQLITMTLSNDAVGLIGNDATGAPTMSLLGRPIVVTEKMPALANGSGNEIMFVDLSFYLLGDRQAVSIDSSPHSRFLNDETELRIIERVDGRPWIQSALTPLNGSDTLTPFVGLTDA
jgi:HK97 family phage major capsid protein